MLNAWTWQYITTIAGTVKVGRKRPEVHWRQTTHAVLKQLHIVHGAVSGGWTNTFSVSQGILWSKFVSFQDNQSKRLGWQKNNLQANTKFWLLCIQANIKKIATIWCLSDIIDGIKTHIKYYIFFNYEYIW